MNEILRIGNFVIQELYMMFISYGMIVISCNIVYVYIEKMFHKEKKRNNVGGII
jgi:hypothetical protein